MSPFLFNAVIDELLETLESTGLGLQLSDDTQLAGIACADDILIMEERDKDVQKLLDICNEFFDRRGMSLNIDKSVAITTRYNKSAKHIYTLT